MTRPSRTAFRLLALVLLPCVAACHDPLGDLIEDTTTQGACFYACSAASRDCTDPYGLSESECEDTARALCGTRPERLTYIEDGSCLGPLPEWYKTWGPDAIGG